jgi:phage-related protein (TIGR01555 family)
MKRDLVERIERHKKRYRMDGWSNPFSALGTERDRSTYTQFLPGTRLSVTEQETLYAENDVASRICDTMPEYSLRKGIGINVAPDDEADDPEQALKDANETASAAMKELKTLKAVQRFTDAGVWGNVFGGSAILPGGADGASGEQLIEPLDENRIKKISHLNVIDRRHLTPMDWYDDPMEAKFGEPKTYLITPFITSRLTAENIGTLQGISVVHETRLLLFGGVRTSTERRQRNEGWQDSLLDRIYKVLQQFGVGFDTLAHIIEDANQGVWKLEGLIDALAADEQDVIQGRMAMADMSRSAVRALVLDAEQEDFVRQNFSWSGFREPFELLMQRLSTAARQPVSVIMGRAPSGMDATGEHDTKNFYDQVESYRKNEIEPNLERLIGLLLKASDGPTRGKEPENWELTFPSLWSTTPKEEAEIYNVRSQGDKSNVEAGILLPEEIALSRYGPNADSGTISIDVSARMDPDGFDEPEPEPVEEPIQEPVEDPITEPADE